MTKRVLAFLMVIAMVFSLIPTVVVADDAATTAENGYTMYLQKAHNQTEGTVTWDIYLQANNADQGNVTGIEFKVTPATDKAVDLETAGVNGDGFTVSAAATEVIASATEENASLAVGTAKTPVMTLVLSNTDAGDAAAFSLTEVEVSTDAETKNRYPMSVETTDDYAGVVTVETTPCTAHDTTEGWTAGLPVTEGELAEGKYYLTADVELTGSLDVPEDKTVTVCLNGYNITGATVDDEKDPYRQMFYLTNSGATLNVCDCTATGSREDYTAGKLLPKDNQGGAFRVEYGNDDTTINVYGGIIDGAQSTKREASVALVYGGTFNMYGGLVSNFPKVVGQESGNTPNGYGPIILRGTNKGEAAATIKDVTFVGCGSSIIGVAHGGSGDTASKDDAATLVVENVTMVDSETSAVAIDISHANFKSVTIKGDCQFDAPVYLANGETVNLGLGEDANVHIETATDHDEAGFNGQVKMAEGFTELTAGTVVYDNQGVYVTYDKTAGQFTFADEGHVHNGVVFKVWDYTDRLPSSGDYILMNPVNVTEAVEISDGKTLNLCLNGQTVTAVGSERFFNVQGTLNLYDCSSTYDEEGNWLSAGTGELHGYTGDFGAIQIKRGTAGNHNAGEFNMYGGRICHNGKGTDTSGNGGAIYLYGTGKNATTTDGGQVNIYGGEICYNTVGYAGSAITTACSQTDLEEGYTVGMINISGGKIHHNTCQHSTSNGYGQGTIYAQGYTQVNISGGEISDNTARQGGAVLACNRAQVNVSGGKIANNKAEAKNSYGGNGGAICTISSAATIDITGGTWTGNQADVWGGMVYAHYKNFNVSNATITGNSATTAGGAIYANNGNAIITNCELTGNVTDGAGAAIYIAGGRALTIKNTTITENITKGADAYGAVYFDNVGGRLQPGERVIITGNYRDANEGTDNRSNVEFKDTGTARTVAMVQLNGMTDGSHIDFAYTNATFNAEGLLASAVVTSSAAPSTWECGWLTYYQTAEEAAGKNISYRDSDGDGTKEFTFGHWHGDTEYVAMTSAKLYTASSDPKNYYLAEDIELTATWKPYSVVTCCMNGHTIKKAASAGNFIGIQINSGYTFTMVDCTASYDANGHLVKGGTISGFTNTGNGTAVYAAYENASGYRNLSISGVEFKNNVSNYPTGTVGYGGGAIQVRSSTRLYINGCKFTNCGSATDGGAINIIKNKGDSDSTGNTVTWGEKSIKNTVFENNYAGRNGGAIVVIAKVGTNAVTVDNCKFTGNYATTYATTGATAASADTGRGGAIALITGTVNVNNCTFDGNLVKHKEGVTQSTTRTLRGGAIYNSSGTLSVTNGTFSKNDAAAGGAIFNGTTATVTGTTFKGNTATNGGAIYNSNSTSTLTVTNATFTENSADEYGGALRAEHGTITLNSSSFNSNTATYGGAVVFNGHANSTEFPNGNTMTIQKATTDTDAVGCTFTGNNANQGGAIYLWTYSNYNANTDISDAEFDGNIAKAGGGAIYANSQNASDTEGPIISITNTTMKNNKGQDGSALSLNRYSETTLDDCTITGNICTASYGAVFVQSVYTSLTLKGLTKICDNTGNIYYPKADLFLRGDNGTSMPKVTAVDLEDGSKIGINTGSNRYTDTTTNGKILGTAAKASTAVGNVNDFFFSDDQARFITHVVTVDDADKGYTVGDLVLTNYVDEETGLTYDSLQAAYDAAVADGDTKFVVQAGDSIEPGLTLSTIDVIDLNGHDISKITIEDENTTLKLIDSKTNDFDIADGVYGQVTTVEGGSVASNYKDPTTKNQYVVITKDGVSTAHRVYASILSRILRPISKGAGFKAIYAGDQMVTDAAEFGIELTFQEPERENRTFVPVAFEGKMDAGLPEEGNPNQKLMAITNLAPDDWENYLYGKAYVTVNGVTVYSAERNLRMRDMAESALASTTTNLSEAVKEQLLNLIEEYGLEYTQK